MFIVNGYTVETYYGSWICTPICREHDPIDNGTRVTECRACKTRLEFRNWEWKETP